jgi:hypothetical protein
MGWDKQAVGGAAAANVNVLSSVPIDITDRVGRLLGHVSIDGQPIDVNVTDRVGRLLGIVDSITNPITVASITNAIRAIIQDTSGNAVETAIRNTHRELRVEAGGVDMSEVLEVLRDIRGVLNGGSY